MVDDGPLPPHVCADAVPAVMELFLVRVWPRLANVKVCD